MGLALTVGTYQTVEPNVRLIYCLSIDLIGSTYAGMQLSTRELDRFNVNLVNQVKPHLESLQLTNTILKFTGDGWLLMTEDVCSVPCLCCLGVILTKRFQEEMSISTGIYIDRIPPVRVAICSGRDIQVELPNGARDWVGDSARRATRACQICEPNQVLIDEPVRYDVFRDFELIPLDVTQVHSKLAGKKWEENFPLYVLGDIKSQLAAESNIAPCYVYTLGQLGMLSEASNTAEKAAERLAELSGKLDATGKPYVQDELAIWNRLIFSLPGYASKLSMFKKMRAAKLVPDIQTYNNLMHNAPNYFSASRWLQILQAQGIRPSVNTYNTLMDKAPDYNTAKVLIEAMRAEGV
jgi:class 3 adenylate cyclase